MRLRSSFIPACVLLLAGALLSACGHKAPPRPLLKPLPNPVGELEALQLGESMRVSWVAPESNQDGTPLSDIEQFNLYRMTYNPADECPECRDTSTLWRSVDPDFLKDAQHFDDRYLILDRQQLEPGRGYQYRIEVIADGYPGEPAMVRRPFFPPAAAPVDLRGDALEGFIRIKWRAVEKLDGMNLIGYHIYRGTGDRPLELIPLNETPETGTGYDDFTAIGTETYRYAVRAVWEQEGLRFESLLSMPIHVSGAEAR